MGDAPNMVEACVLNRDEVVLGYPSIPVRLKDVERSGIFLKASKGVLVDDVRIVRVLEDTRGDPGLNGNEGQLL